MEGPPDRPEECSRDRCSRRAGDRPSGGRPRTPRRTAGIDPARRGRGGLPYFLLRFLWLTPFQAESLLDLPGSPDTLDPAVRLWGVSLGAACLVGFVLTLGLIRPWGEVFPGWVPGASGRSVPVALAAVPGLVVAGAMLVEAPALLLSTIEDPPRSLVTVLVFPFPLWGPLLALATWGYVGHRLGAPGGRAGGVH